MHIPHAHRLLSRHFITGLLVTLTISLSSCTTRPATALGWYREAEISDQYKAGDRFMGIRLLGALEITGQPAAGVDLDELSGLAWHRESGTLIAVSDPGRLHRFKPHFHLGMLDGLEWLGSSPLKGADGEPLTGSSADSEGIAVVPETNPPVLLISFEREPRISRYDLDGNWIGDEPLPTGLGRISHYAGRNSALEALTLHPKLGWVTGPERPLKTDGGKLRLSSQSGWHTLFKAEPDTHSALTGMTVTSDGQLLFLERRYRSMLEPLQIRLRKLNPGVDNKPTTVSSFDNGTGWRMDNFEGLTRHEGNRYFAVSDNNGNPLQRALLIYFELLP